MSDKIIRSNMIEEVEKDLFTYSIKVNRQRSIPDRRDGLKIVHRRILDIMYNEIRATNHTVKSARVVGDVLGKRHAHGDSSVYNAMALLVNWFNQKHPILEGQGAWGTITGEGQAAMRYTEIKVSEFGVDCIVGELAEEKNVVDWIPNFDNTDMEPEYFPVRVPILLINGSFGLGYGLSVNIPSHNLAEVIDATLKLIKNPNSQVELIPDHRLPCEIIDTNFKSISNKGNGPYKVRGVIDIETLPNGTHQLIIRSMPNSVSLIKIVENIEKLIEDNVIQVSDTEDKSETNNVEYVITLKKGANPEYTRDMIYRRTQMSMTDSINFEVLDGLEPVRMSYKSYLLSFIDFRKTCKFRLYCNRVQRLQTRYHERYAFIKALMSDNIDQIIDRIRESKNSNDPTLIEDLVKQLNITDLQASYIINASLKRLSQGYLNKYIEEANLLEKEIEENMNKILDEGKIEEEIIEELKFYKKKYGRPRTTRVISQDEVNKIPKGEFKVIITKKNFIKKVPSNIKIGKLRDDSVKFVIDGCNSKAILLLDELGRIYRVPIHILAVSDNSTNGIEIMKIIKKCTSNIINVLYEPDIISLSKEIDKHYLVSLSSTGYIKKMDLDDFLNTPKSGMLYSKIGDDVIKYVEIINEVKDGAMVIYNRNKALKISTQDIPHQRRNTKGSKTFTNCMVEGMSIVHDDNTNEAVLVITSRGYINKISPVTIPLSTRNRAGQNVIKLSKNDNIRNIISVYDDTTITVDTTNGVQEFNVNDIPEGSSISKGKKVISLKANDVIIDII